MQPLGERGNAKMQYLFVNGRWIRDRSLGHALQEAYRGLLMTGRYAVAFLFFQLPPDQVESIKTVPGLTVSAGETMRVGYIYFDAAGRSSDNPLKDVRVRRAIAHAIDREQ